MRFLKILKRRINFPFKIGDFVKINPNSKNYNEFNNFVKNKKLKIVDIDYVDNIVFVTLNGKRADLFNSMLLIDWTYPEHFIKI